ncbi:MAG: 5-methyltetrahydropteroyltriglutamate--homocysteine S-methyltransferase [Bacteroidota bacterium]
MKTHNLGYPRMGSHRQLKRACERYWATPSWVGKITNDELQSVARDLRQQHWQLQQDAGIDLIPSNDFSFYDQVLDMSLTVGAIPDRYAPLQVNPKVSDLDLYFAMARGYQQDGLDITAIEMTKWFDTNYHYIVPEFQQDQTFHLTSTKILDEFEEAKKLGMITKPVIIGPVTYLWLGKEKEDSFHRIELLDRLLPVYHEILKLLVEAGATYVQLDEPCLATDLSDQEQAALQTAYRGFRDRFPQLKIILANYFDCYGDNLTTALSLPVHMLHLDLVRCPSQLDDILESGKLSAETSLSLGVVDGRNIWKNDYQQSLHFIHKATDRIGSERVMIAPSCSLLHIPGDLEQEDETSRITPIRPWLAFAKQKLQEIADLSQLAQADGATQQPKYSENQLVIQARRESVLINRPEVQSRVQAVTKSDTRRSSSFATRKVQQQSLDLPQFPTTTIGSFPQTGEVRQQRAKFKKGELTREKYHSFLRQETEQAIRWQEEVGLDVLVHGEFERNDMVEYFGEQLEGFAFTKQGWVQSYGSRCVKPPIIYGDVSRPTPMTVDWTAYAQSLTDRPVKGMLTGPVTILQWSFVRDDQPRADTCAQIALAIRDEVIDLEKASIRVIQVDEPALREGLPLRQADWANYLTWAVRAFRLATSGIRDETQVHTHMCYSEFNDIIESIAALDADVITIECSRSQMDLLDAFADFQYPNDIGPGVYDIHSPRVPSEVEMVQLLEKAQAVLPASQLWVNPDCGLKTRGWEETKPALEAMVAAARQLRQSVGELA